MTSCSTCGPCRIERWPRRFGRRGASTVPLAVRLAFEFLVLTTARWGEVRWAEWADTDRLRRSWDPNWDPKLPETGEISAAVKRTTDPLTP